MRSGARVLVRLASPDEYEAVGELREAAYVHDYEISDHYRETLRDAAPRGGHEVWVAVDRHTGRLFGTVVTPGPVAISVSSAGREN